MTAVSRREYNKLKRFAAKQKAAADKLVADNATQAAEADRLAQYAEEWRLKGDAIAAQMEADQATVKPKRKLHPMSHNSGATTEEVREVTAVTAQPLVVDATDEQNAARVEAIRANMRRARRGTFRLEVGTGE